MTLSELSIKRPLFAWMLMTGLIVLGAISFTRMGISQLPDVDFPVVSVNIRLEGAAPEVIETQIVDIIEDAVMGIQGVQNVTSESENSEGTVRIEFDLNHNIDLAVQDVQAKVAQVQQKLPVNAKPPRISKVNPDDQPIILVSLNSDKYPLRYLMEFVNDRLKDQFSMVSGVGDITLGGYVDPNLRIWLSEKKLNKYDMTVTDVINTVQKESSESPAGIINYGDKQFFVRTMGEAGTVPQFNSININSRNGQPNYAPIPLLSVANIEEGLADATMICRGNGIPGVNLSILKQRGANAVETAKAVYAKINEIRKTLPDGMHLDVNFDATKYIERSVGELNFVLILSVILTAFVCWLFLGSWSSTVNVLLSMPTSVVGTFIILYFSGFTLNIFTLLGLSLSVGIVVDDSIIVLENIVRHMERGKDKYRAALDGSREITFAATAATVSIVAIFLPVAFLTGVIGRYFFQFGVTITAAVLLSLVNALTLTPMFCSRYVDVKSKKTRIGRSMDWLMDKTTRLYTGAITWALARRGKVIITALIFFALSFVTLIFINQELLPTEDQGRFNIRVYTPVGSSLAYSDSKITEVEKFLAACQEVSRYVLQAGGGSPGDAYHGNIIVTMKDPGTRGINKKAGHELSQQEFMAACRAFCRTIKDIRASIQDYSIRNFAGISHGYPVEFSIQGPDWDALAGFSRQIMAGLDRTGLVTDLDSDYQEGAPEIDIIPDRQRARESGVSVVSIDQAVNAMIGGVVVNQYTKGGHRYDINVKLEDTGQAPADKIKSLYVWNSHNTRVQLSRLVTNQENTAKVTINRYNRSRSIAILANVKQGKSQQAALQAAETISKKILPPEYFITKSGSSQSFSDTFHSLIFALFLGIFIAYMILAVQFNSFIDPVTVLIALPFSASGAFFALLLSGRSLNIYSMIGFILLMGIVKKNSILLVDFTKQVRARGKTVKAALLEACPIRLRPILMTSLATIAGAIPPALSIGPSAQSRIPMAIAIIGGVIVSTFLTIFVVPCVYSVLSRFESTSQNSKVKIQK
jgi:hydrophobe/amphiphile efflux-1 (HAE1) family protein